MVQSFWSQWLWLYRRKCKGTDGVTPCRWKMVDLHPQSTFIWLVNRQLFEALYLFLSPDLFFFFFFLREAFAYWHIQDTWVLFCFLHNKFFVLKAKKCDDYSFCSKIWAEFWAIKTLSNCKISFPQAFYVMGDKGVGKQIYCLFFLKAFLFILDSGNGTFTLMLLGFSWVSYSSVSLTR